MRNFVSVLLLIVANMANAEVVTWEASGVLSDVDTSGNFISEFPSATTGTPFRVTIVFDSSSSFTSQIADSNGVRYRYADALKSFSLNIGGIEVQRAADGFAAVDIWDNYSIQSSDGFVVFQGVQSSQTEGFAQVGLILRGPESLDIYSGPGLPTTPSLSLTSLSQTVFQFIDETDFIVGNVDSLTRVFAVADTDGDGVNDDIDLCPATVEGEPVDSDGCSDAQFIGVAGENIQSLIDDAATGDKARKKLLKAQDKLDDALAELAAGDAKKSLKKIGDAAKELLKAKKEGADVDDLLDQLVAFAESQAQAAIDAADAAGGDAKKIDKARNEFAKAGDELAKGKPDKAIDRYAKAWDHANKA